VPFRPLISLLKKNFWELETKNKRKLDLHLLNKMQVLAIQQKDRQDQFTQSKKTLMIKIDLFYFFINLKDQQSK